MQIISSIPTKFQEILKTWRKNQANILFGMVVFSFVIFIVVVFVAVYSLIFTISEL